MKKPQSLFNHALLLLPLAATQLMQRLEHVVDNRFMAHLGQRALEIHNIQFNFFLAGQAIGLATATSILIFWRRKESAGKQGSILVTHLLYPTLLGIMIAAAAFPWTGQIAQHFRLPLELLDPASSYLRLGLANMVVQIGYAAVNAMLIASEQRMLSMLFIAGILATKAIAGYWITHIAWQSGMPIHEPLTKIAFVTFGAILVFLMLAAWKVARRVDGWNKLDGNEILKIWPSELGTATIRSFAPIAFVFMLADVQTNSGFYVTYQLALHLAYILTLPLSSGVQVAVRDASAEYSRAGGGYSLFKSEWFSYFLFVSLVPAEALLLIATLTAPMLMKAFYSYEVPSDQADFLGVYFIACAIGQLGHIFLIQIRAAQKNWVAMLNIMTAELFVQLGATYFLVKTAAATPYAIAWVILSYCAAYMLLNWIGFMRIQRDPFRFFGLTKSKAENPA